MLPLQNLSADPDKDYFSDGLAEEILNALSQIEGLRVAARTSSFSFKGKATDVGDVGRRLHVGTVLEGSVRRSGSRVRVTVQLVDARNGFQLWSERYDRQMEDIFDVQDEIARAIADRLSGRSSCKRTICSLCGRVAWRSVVWGEPKRRSSRSSEPSRSLALRYSLACWDWPSRGPAGWRTPSVC